MKLKEYLNREGLTQAEFAKRLKVSQGMVSQWIINGVAAERVLKIEAATEGKVSRHDLRPDLYPRESAA